jgi:16S rRNA (uracil1498-N3)-methyltransferase
MARRRFFVDAVRRGQAELSGDAAQHLRRVLRAECGQRFEISDNQSVYLAEIDGFGKGCVSFRVLARLEAEDPPVRLTLLASLIKFDRFEWMLEKATELGVDSVIPVQAARSERGLEKAAAKRLERWRRIVLESSQQSRRARLPDITAPKSLSEALGIDGAHRYVLEEKPRAAPILSLLPEADRRSCSDTVCLLVGPEGGWTDAERERASASGWAAVSLGPQILRTETAAIAALAVLSSAWCGQTSQSDRAGL